MADFNVENLTGYDLLITMSMKKYLYLVVGLLLYVAAPCWAQCQVQFRLMDCRDSSEQSFTRIDTLLLYRTDGLHIAGLRLPLSWNETDTVTLPAPGDYHLVYPNLLGQIMDKVIHIEGSGPVAIDVCSDSLDRYTHDETRGTGRLALLSDGESLVLQLERRGCFEFRIEQIVISRMEGRYYARQYDMRRKFKKDRSTGGWKWRYKRGALLREIVLTPKQLDDFLRFENELLQVTVVGCTTSDHYTVTSASGYAIDRWDGSCSWYGYDFLEASFFPDKED